LPAHNIVLLSGSYGKSSSESKYIELGNAMFLDVNKLVWKLLKQFPYVWNKTWKQIFVLHTRQLQRSDMLFRIMGNITWINIYSFPYRHSGLRYHKLAP
jgi:hypothetical protein